MANAAKRMKEKKARMAALRAKAVSEPVVEEVVEGTVSGIAVIEEGGDYTEETLNEKLKSELISIAEDLEIETSGTKSELIERILGA